MSVKSGIYRFLCTATGKSYVGSAANLRKRQCQHVASLKAGNHHSPVFQNAWNKYGPDAFVFEVLEFVEMSRLIEREQYFIDSLAAYGGNGLNAYPSAGSPLGRTVSRSTRAKLAEANIGRRHTEETKAKMSASRTGLTVPREVVERRASKIRGRKRPPEVVAAVSAAHRGKALSPEHRAKIAAANRGRAHTEETRKRMSELRKGYKPTEETRLKIREARARQVITDETRAKISEAGRNRVVTDEFRAKISAIKKGTMVSEETRRKISEAQKGVSKAPRSQTQKESLARSLAEYRRREREAKTGIIGEWTSNFLEGLKTTQNVTHAARLAGVFPSTAHARRKKDPLFAAAWAEALAWRAQAGRSSDGPPTVSKARRPRSLG